MSDSADGNVQQISTEALPTAVSPEVPAPPSQSTETWADRLDEQLGEDDILDTNGQAARDMDVDADGEGEASPRTALDGDDVEGYKVVEG